MDFISRAGSFISDLFHSAYCYFNSEEASCAAPQSAAQTDSFRQVELREIQIQQLIETSRQVPVGCYIQMHQVPNFEGRPQAPRNNHKQH